jgi:DNA-binding NtrC family response regulator
MATPGTESPWLRPILVVEDDLLLAQTVLRMLERAGFTVRWVPTIAMAKLELSPALVLADIRLPDGDSRSLQGYWPGVPILTMSGQPPADLQKPFTMQELLSAVRARWPRSDD